MFIKILVFQILFFVVANLILAQDINFEEQLEQIIKEYDIPAIAAAIVKKDEIKKIGVAGIKKSGESEKVSIDDKFHLGSCGKSFTGILAQILVNKNLIKWETRPIDIFPKLKPIINNNLNDITFLDLLTHRAGIPGYMYWHEKEQIPKFDGDEKEKREKMVFWQLAKPPAYTIGEFHYSNVGYVIAASMMEEVTGKSWEQLIKEYLFEPLKITSYGFGRPALNDKTQPWGHWKRFVGQTPQEPVAASDFALDSVERPAGDTHLSIIDCAKYIQFHLNGLQGKSDILDKKSFQNIHKIRDQYSLGWSEEYRHGERCSIHFGSDATFFAVMVVFHEKDLGLVIVANSATPKAKRGVSKLLRDLY